MSPGRRLKRKVGYEVDVPVKRMRDLTMFDNEMMDPSGDTSGSSD